MIIAYGRTLVDFGLIRDYYFEREFSTNKPDSRESSRASCPDMLHHSACPVPLSCALRWRLITLTTGPQKCRCADKETPCTFPSRDAAGLARGRSSPTDDRRPSIVQLRPPNIAAATSWPAGLTQRESSASFLWGPAMSSRRAACPPAEQERHRYPAWGSVECSLFSGPGSRWIVDPRYQSRG